MYPLELIQSVRLITDVCLEVARGENVLCIADGEESMEVMILIASECKARGAEVAIVLTEPRRRQYHVGYKEHEPPRSIARAMKEADVVINMGSGLLLDTQARREATAAGVKFATLGAATKEYLAKLNLTKEDLLEVRALTEKIAQRLTAATSAHLTTRAGTDLLMSLEGRNGVAMVPFGKRGSPCIIPDYAEATCAPIENSVEGVALVDGTMIGAADFEGLVEEPFEIHFEKGRIVKISDGKDAEKFGSFLYSLEEGVRVFAELGVNSNHRIPKRLTGTRIDDAIAGHVHLGLGKNEHIGGNSRVETHLDVLVTFATLLLDENAILENGNLKI
jgi:2,5-dihydroxypyridine 5,6-dioxygenase